MPRTIIEDGRIIDAIFTESEGWIVGNRGITEILPYQETGEMAYITWFAVYEGNSLRSRVQSKYIVEIRYA